MLLKKIFNAWFLFFAILYGALSVLYIDYWSSDAKGIFLSYLLFFACIILTFVDIRKGFFLYIVLFITISPYPRNILDVYESLQVNKDISYNTITSLSVSGMSMVQWLSIFFLLVFFIKVVMMQLYINRFFLISILLFISLPIVGVLLQLLLDPAHFKFREVVTGVRFPLYLLEGLFGAVYLTGKYKLIDVIIYFLKIAVFVSIAFCCRAPLFLLITISQKTPALEMGVIPHIPLALMFGILMLLNFKSQFKDVKRNVRLISIILIFSLLSPSRSQFFVFGVSFIFFLILNNSFVKNSKYIALSALTVILIGFLAFLANPRFFDFILWKISALNVVNRTVSGSEQVRVYEFYNITYKLWKSPHYLLFGNGFSGYFTFKEIPLPSTVKLDLMSYSNDEVNSGIIYHPHFFTNIILLKFGALGFLLYCLWPMLLFFKAFKLMKKMRRKIRNAYLEVQDANFIYFLYCTFLVFLSYSFLLEMHFRGYYAVLFPFTFIIIIKLGKELGDKKDTTASKIGINLK